MRSCFLILLLSAAQAQTLSFGVKGGVPAQIPIGRSGTTVPFGLGASVEIRLAPHLSVETGAFFHRMGKENSTAILSPTPDSGASIFFDNTRAHAFEVPVLAKYRFLSERRAWRPFLSAGTAIRRTTIENQEVSSILAGASLTFLRGDPLRQSTIVSYHADPAVAAGVDVRTGRFHLEPEVRYSYWAAGKDTVIRKNQVNFLLGFRF
jgi:hypothetical protein